VLKQVVRWGTADALVKEDEHSCHPCSLFGETIGVVFVDPLQEAVGFHLAQVITELGEGVVLGREGKGRAHDLRWRVKHPDSSGQCAQLRRSEEALLLPVSAHRPTPAQTLDASEDARITAKGRPTEPETE
jgi:hypothetical protein